MMITVTRTTTPIILSDITNDGTMVFEPVTVLAFDNELLKVHLREINPSVFKTPEEMRSIMEAAASNSRARRPSAHSPF